MKVNYLEVTRLHYGLKIFWTDMESRDMIGKMAFSFLKRKVSPDFLKEMEENNISPLDFFNIPTKELIRKLGIRQDPEFEKLAREEALMAAKKEWDKIQNHNIKPLFVLDEDYPEQLAEIPDAPLVLYKLGDADLEAGHMLSVVGTRKPTAYGIDFTNKLIDETGDYFPDLTVVSGLAYGIDSKAHTKALEKNLPTIAVVAHGLNMIYPAAHRELAKKIIYSGGAIISEYPFDTQPFRPNFLARNRIVAGLSSAVVVVESKIKGGAMSTANYAFLYNRDVMALPGRSSDVLSSGCNLLIRKNKAHLIECAADLIEVVGWQPLNIPVDTQQRNLFPELEGDSKRIFDLIQFKSEPMQVDEIVCHTGLSASKIMTILGELEFDGILLRLPGNRYTLA